MSTLLDQILAAAYREDKVGSLNAVKKVLKTKDGFKDLNPEKKRQVFDIFGTAYLSLLHLEGAAKYFKQSDNLLRLESVFELAIRHGKYKLVKELMGYGRQKNIKALQEVQGSYPTFLQQKALPYVPLYRDEKEGFSINEEALEEILSEIRKPREEVLAEAVNTMETAGSRNLVKKFILAHYSQDSSLIHKYEDEFNGKAHAGRQDISAAMGNYCQDNGLELKKTLQAGDNDNYFPSVAHIFLIKENERPIVFKENIRLHQDYSSLAGYSMEKEILEIIRHDNIVNYLGGLGIGNIEFLVLEFMPGVTLERYVAPDNLLPIEKVIEIIKTLAEVIGYLHQNNIICMDIKDKNVMYDGKKVTYFDFGVSQIISAERLAMPEPFISSLLTTPEYVTPEMALTFKAYKKTDIFQLGILFYKLLVGKNPFVRYDLYDFVEGDEYRESEIIKFVLPTIFNDFDKSPEVFKEEPEILKLLEGMLNKNFRKRPTPRKIKEAL